MTPDERTQAARLAAHARYTDEQRERAKAHKELLAAKRLMPCPYCGDPVGKAGRVKCPKDDCNLRHLAARASIMTHIRRAQMAGVDSERFSSREIFERDEWRCGICEQPVDPDIRHPDPLSASLDHIVPLSLGGAHTRSNTRCTHLTCNIKRNNRVAEVAA